MNTHQYVRELSQEAHEILQNIRDCEELTYQQRNELIQMVEQDVEEKLALARGMYYVYTGRHIQSVAG